jgi:hypothetical protein
MALKAMGMGIGFGVFELVSGIWHLQDLKRERHKRKEEALASKPSHPPWIRHPKTGVVSLRAC